MKYISNTDIVHVRIVLLIAIVQENNRDLMSRVIHFPFLRISATVIKRQIGYLINRHAYSGVDVASRELYGNRL